MASTKKKWIIGCSGCLIITIILFVVAGILGKVGFDKLQESSKEANSSIFGSDLPAGYTTVFGMPIPSKEGVSNFMMIMTPEQHMLMAFDAPTGGEELKSISLDDEEQLEAVAQSFLKKAAESSKRMEINQASVEDVSIQTVSDGKRFPIINMLIKNRKGTYSPISVSLLPMPGDRLVVLMDMNPIKQTTNPNEDFSPTYQALDQELKKLVEFSTLDDRIERL